MNEEMLKKLRDYGADIHGIEDRFMGDMELYMSCYKLILEDRNFPALRKAIEDKDYQQAFNSAHALKGVTDNMGLSPLCREVCVLVEALRAMDYSEIDKQYEAVAQAFDRVKDLF